MDIQLLSARLAGRYQLLREIGAGGMATVYLARDLKHDREVALKVLRPELTAVVGAERFLQEIRITAKLDHPHILTLIDSGESDHVLWYTLPYVRGESLRQKLTREGMLGVDDALALTRQIAGALDYAHRQGVIHRDIKPENILLFEGEAMLTDFGVALAVTHAGGARLTESGLSLGTPQYMSPEQATGDRTLDARTDVYSLAAVLYEMLAGEPPHTGPSAQSVIAKLLTTPPTPLRIVRESVPEWIEGAVHKALSKLPVDRHPTAAHFAASLTPAPSGTPAGDVAAWARRATPRVARATRIALSVVGLVALGFLAWSWAKDQFARTTVASASRQVTFTGRVELADISADGRFLASASREGARRKLLVQDLLGGTAPRELASLDWISSIRWSPSGAQLLVSGMDSGRVVAYLVPFLAGDIRRLPVASSLDLNMKTSWSPDESRVALSDNQSRSIVLVTVATGDTTRIRLRARATWLGGAEWSPAGNLLAFGTSAEAPLQHALWVIRPDGTGQRLVIEDTVVLSSPQWSPAGDALYYLRGGSELWKMRVASASGAPRGRPQALLAGMETFSRFNDASTSTHSISRQRARLAYAKGMAFANLWRLVPGAPGKQLTVGTAPKFGVAVSPDGKWAAFVQRTSRGADVFRVPIEGGTPQQVTNTGRAVAGFLGSTVAWSPDGSRLAFGVIAEGAPRVATIEANGDGFRVFADTRLSAATSNLAWAPGASILYQWQGHRNFGVLDPVTGDDRPLVPDDTLGYMFSARYAPDSERVALAWNRPAQAKMGPWVITLNGPSQTFFGNGWDWPIGWSRDGRSFYVIGTPERESVIRRVPLSVGPQQVVMRLPMPNSSCAPVFDGQPVAFVCMIPEFVSDVWIIDNFDPDLR